MQVQHSIEGEWNPAMVEENAMPWVRVDDAFVMSPRVTQAAKRLPRAGRARVVALWLEGLTHAQRHATDGLIRDDDLDLFIVEEQPQVVARALVHGELWERVDNGYRIKGFLDHYPSAERRDELAKRREGERRASRPRPRDRARPRNGAAPPPGTHAAPADRSETETETNTGGSPPNPPHEGDQRGDQAIEPSDLDRALGPEWRNAAKGME